VQPCEAWRHIPSTPFTTPRSPSPQRLCRRLQTPVVDAMASAHAARMRTPATPRRAGSAAPVPQDWESLYSGAPCARSRMGGTPGHPAAHRWGTPHKEPEDPDAKKMRVAMQQFQDELRCRLAAQGVEEYSPLSDALSADARVERVVRGGPRRHSTSQLRPPPPAPRERRLSERHFDNKDRLEESTLSELAACMQRRLT
jgi:hypothetical protein